MAPAGRIRLAEQFTARAGVDPLARLQQRLGRGAGATNGSSAMDSCCFTEGV